MPFIGAMTLTQMVRHANVDSHGPCYAKKNFNAGKPVWPDSHDECAPWSSFSRSPSRRSPQRQPPLKMLTVGALFYAVGVGSVSLARGFGGFWLSHGHQTIGELM